MIRLDCQPLFRKGARAPPLHELGEKLRLDKARTCHAIDRLQLASSPPCWMTINERIIISSIVPVIQYGRQGLCRLNLTGMVANHLFLSFFSRSLFLHFSFHI